MEVGIVRMNILVLGNASYLNQKKSYVVRTHMLTYILFLARYVYIFAKSFNDKKDNASERKDLVGKR